ncbi:MAG: hypothetical protein WA941_13070 [Nitrososphaeraceae archaeon]
MVSNLMQGVTDDFPCDCVHNNVANGSFTRVTPDLKYAQLITCGKCNFKWYSNREGIFDYGPCPRCNSTSPLMAELNQKRLAQGANGAKQEKIKELQRVIDAKFNIEAKSPTGPVVHRPKR